MNSQDITSQFLSICAIKKKTQEVISIHLSYRYGLFTMFPGFPPPDRDVRDFLTRQMDEAQTRSRMVHFLIVLFRKTADVLKKELKVPAANRRSECTTRFREYMTSGQNARATGERRCTFYKGIVYDVEVSLTSLG